MAGAVTHRLVDGLRLAVGTLTVWPVRPPSRVDRRVAGSAMALAPVVGAGLGLVAALVLWGSGQVFGRWLTALLTVAALGLATRLIHWDGLADLADGLGSSRPAAGALEIMRRGDVGPFGVVAVVLVLAIQVAAVAELASPAGVTASPTGVTASAAVLAAVVLGRWSMTLACRRGVRSARPHGLGAAAAASVTPWLLAAGAVSTAALVAGCVLGGLSAVAAVWAVAAATLWSVGLTAVAVHRLGGITGDVLGALAETSTAVALLVFAAA